MIKHWAGLPYPLYSRIVQSGEQRIVNPRVGGSSPSTRAKWQVLVFVRLTLYSAEYGALSRTSLKGAKHLILEINRRIGWKS